MTESNFYLQKFCINFGACKRIKTQFSPKKAWAMRVQRLNNMFIYFRLIPSSVSMNKSLTKRVYLYKFAKLVLTVYRRAISAIRNIKFLLWFVWVTSCFNSGIIQWSLLKNVHIGESLSNGQACDFSRFFRDSSFWKLPERYHPFFNCSKQKRRHQNNVPNMFKVNNKGTRMMLLTSFWCLYFC